MTETREAPLRRDAERNRARILEAARDVFATDGFSASFTDIAARADVALGTVYRRFPDRQALIDALFEERVKEIVAIFVRAEQEPDAWAAFVGALEQLFELVACDRGTWELLMNDARGGRSIAEQRDCMEGTGRALLRRAQEQGAVRADLQPSDLSLVKIALGSVADATRAVDRDVWRRLLTIVLDGLRAEPGEPTPLPGEALQEDRVDEAMRAVIHCGTGRA